MLQSIKGSLSSPWLRYSLFGVLILSFGVWGIGDVLRRLVSPSAEVLAEGDGITIDRQSFAQHWQRATANFRAQGLTSQQLLAGPMPRLVLDRLLGQALLQKAAEDLRLKVPSSVLQKTIAQEPMFRGEDGKFASWRFLSVLRQTGLSEQAYLQELQTRLVQGNLLESLAFDFSLPDAFLRELLAAEQELRELQILHLPLLPLQTIPDPGDEGLKSFMQKEQALFRLPEYRRFAYATIALATDSSLNETLSETFLLAYYEEHKQEFSEEEKRSFLQLFFVEEEEVRQAETALKSGSTIDEVAAKFSSTPLSIQEQAREDLLDEDIAGSVFAMAQKGDLAVVKGGLGWYLLRLERIVPDARVEPRLRACRFDKKTPARARRSTLCRCRVAGRRHAACGRIATRSRRNAGLDRRDNPVARRSTIPDRRNESTQRLWDKIQIQIQIQEEEERELLTLGFTLSTEGEVSQPFEIERKDGRTQALFLELRERQEARQADLTQKRAAVLAVYRDLKRREMQQTRAKKLVQEVQEAGSTKEAVTRVARKEGLSLSQRRVARNSQEWTADFLASLFVAQEGDVLTAQGERGDVVVRLASVRRPAVLSFTASQVEAFAENLAAESALPLASYRQALQNRAKLRLDEEAFAAFVAAGLSP